MYALCLMYVYVVGREQVKMDKGRKPLRDKTRCSECLPFPNSFGLSLSTRSLNISLSTDSCQLSVILGCELTDSNHLLLKGRPQISISARSRKP